jgi:hypothetical protein
VRSKVKGRRKASLNYFATCYSEISRINEKLSANVFLKSLPKDENYTGKSVLSWNGNMGTCDLVVPKTDLHFEKGMAEPEWAALRKDPRFEKRIS